MKKKMKKNKNINKFFLIYNDLKKYNRDISNSEIIQATKDLIKYSKKDYVSNFFIKPYDNDNRKPVDVCLKENNFSTYNSYFNDFDTNDLEELNQFKKFQQINNLY